MKKQSETEWLEQWFDRWNERYGSSWLTHDAQSRHLIAALKRRGWRAPEQRTKKGRTK